MEKLNVQYKIIKVICTEPSGVIIGQKPAPGDQLSPAEKIILYVSKNVSKKTVTVPPALPKLTQEVREILQRRHVPPKYLNFILRGRLDYNILNRVEDEGMVYICSLNYDVRVFLPDNRSSITSITGGVETWAYADWRCKQFALNEAAEKIAVFVGPKIYPQFEQDSFLSTIDKESRDWWKRVSEISKEIDDLEEDLQ